jgi:hypothetical protein
MNITLDYAIIGAGAGAILLVLSAFVAHLRSLLKARSLVIPKEPEKTLESLLDETFTGDLDWPRRSLTFPR